VEGEVGSVILIKRRQSRAQVDGECGVTLRCGRMTGLLRGTAKKRAQLRGPKTQNG
jgi:hypothetical protein